MGALSGVASHLKGAGEGALLGGIPGAIAGAANPRMAQQQFTDVHNVQHAAAQSAIQQVQFARDNHDAQMAQAQINLHMLNQQFNSLPKDFQDHLMQEGAEAGQHLINNGVDPVAHVDNEADAKQQLAARMQINSDNPMGALMLPDGRGGDGWNIFEVPNNNKLVNAPTEITIGFTADGDPIKKTFPPNSISVGQRFALETAAMADQAKSHLQNQKNAGAANNAQIRANAANKPSTDFVEGTDAEGNQVAGTPQELQAAGVANYNKMPALVQGQTLAARELTSPDGLFSMARNQVLSLNKAGKLGPIASRVNNFVAGKGLDGDQLAFLDTLKLISTKLMQAHVGARGSKDMLAHFESLVPENSAPAALMSALNDEFQYVNSVAKRPR
jgi:hypothetical protein